MIPRAPRKITAQEIRRRLEVQGHVASARTIERDLQNLSRRLQLVADESARPYGWSWSQEADFEFAPRLSTSQSVALLLAQTHLRTLLPRALISDLAPLFDAARRDVSATGWEGWHLRTAVVPTNMPLLSPEVSSGVQDDVHTALALRRCLSGRYRTKGNAEPKEMVIHPLGLIVRGAAQYLVCTLRSYVEVRHLALHRLSDTRVLDETSATPADFDFTVYARSHGLKYRSRGRIELVVQFIREAAEHLRDTPLARDQVVREMEGGTWTEVTATVEDDETLRWWLLGFGCRVKVMQPQSLRDDLRKELEAAAGHYASA